MQVTLKANLSDAQLREIRKDLEGFHVVEQNNKSVLVSSEKVRLETFLEKHHDEIESGLIAAPGSVVVSAGTTYDVAEDGSWRKRRNNE